MPNSEELGIFMFSHYADYAHMAHEPPASARAPAGARVPRVNHAFLTPSTLINNQFLSVLYHPNNLSH